MHSILLLAKNIPLKQMYYC